MDQTTSDGLAKSNPGWHRHLPGVIRDRLDGRRGLQAAIGNSGWLFADKIFRMGAGLLVGVWVVRYLGPSQLGLLSYAGAFAGLFGTVAQLGLDGIVVRELIKRPERRGVILGTAFAMKLMAATVAVALSILAVMLARPGDTNAAILVGIVALGFLFQSLNVVDFYFQSTVQSKYVVLAASSAFIIATIAKIVLLLVSASLIGFALVGLAEVVLTSVFLLAAYRSRRQAVTSWRFDKAIAKELLSYSWTQIISLIAIVIYMRIDQVMIGQILGDHEVGLFAASVRLSEIWYFIPLSIASSVFPALMAAKHSDNRLFLRRIQTLYDLMAWLGIAVAVITTICAPWIIRILYGTAFAESAEVLSVQIWAGVFVCLGCIEGQWLIIEDLQRYAMYFTMTGATLNVAFNLFLLPLYGVKGAAYATLIAQSTLVVMPFFMRATRPNFYLMVRSLLAPILIIRKRLRA